MIKKKTVCYGYNGENIFADYTNIDGNKKILIHGKGCPSSGSQKATKCLVEKGYDIISPDYIGSHRSDGCFTPKNCMRTISETRGFVHKGGLGKKYQSIDYLGSSFGGLRYFFVKKFDSYYLLAPLLDPLSLGEGQYTEDSVESFFLVMRDTYYNLYRGFDSQEWKSFFTKVHHIETKQSQQQNQVTTILHGKKDRSINYHRSLSYVSKNPATKIELYPYIGHNSTSLIRKLAGVL